LAADHRRRARFAGYQQATDRELPIIRLVSRSN
jgi:DNA-binding CsgD family transcriptional regulator